MAQSSDLGDNIHTSLHFVKGHNVCGTLCLCMSPSMEFLVADVATRSLLMSFVKDNYGLGGMTREGMKSWLCVVGVDVALRPLVLPLLSG